MEYDLHSYVKIVHAIEPAIHTTTQTSAAIDTAGYESLEWVLHVGDAIAGGGSFNVTIEQDEDDPSSPGTPIGAWAVVPTAEIIGALPAIADADTDKVFRVGSIGKMRHQRLVLTEVPSVTGGIVGCVAILSNPHTTPEPDQST